MSDPGKLREALELWDQLDWSDDDHPTDTEWLAAYALVSEAARDYLALLESDAIVIRRDSEGNWPEWAINAVNASYKASAVLDALAESSKP